MLPGSAAEFWTRVRREAETLSTASELADLLLIKKQRRAADERVKPLAAYREAELNPHVPEL